MKFFFEGIMIKYLLLTMLIIVMVSCNESPLSQSQDTNKLPLGKWLVSDVFSTNGPVCYSIIPNDIVEFNLKNIKDSTFYFNYHLGNIAHSDLLKYEITDSELVCKGFYKSSSISDTGILKDTLLPQVLFITRLSDGKIDCRLKLMVYDSETKSTAFGDASRFYATKQ
jgi:hypothetical protein